MSQLPLHQTVKSESVDANGKRLFFIGGVAALLQLACVLSYIIVSVTLGPKPGTVEEYFILLQANPIVALLRSDLITLILLALYLGTFPALFVALRPISPIYTAFATLFTLIAVTVVFATHSDFSMLHLSDRFAEAATAVERSQFLAAGEAVIASNSWHGSGGYMAGILLQGAGVMISVIMLRSKDFSKVTAYAGLLANGLDLIQHILHPFAPSLPSAFLMIAGLFYLVWFPMLARDLFRLGRRGLKKREEYSV
jgi:hypothetical protein